MLILTRRAGETLMIGDNITFTILGVKGSQVRTGIKAPKSIAVHREEVHRRIKLEQQQPGAGGDGTPDQSLISSERRRQHREVSRLSSLPLTSSDKNKDGD